MAKIDTSGIDHLLSKVMEAGATDLLLTAGAPPMCRIDGDMLPLAGQKALTGEDTKKLILGCLGAEAQIELERNLDFDFSFNWKGQARFRGNAFWQRHSAALSLRLIPLAIPTAADLGLPDVMLRQCALPQGLLLVTGPTGSGKSTTQAAMLDWINETRACHIVTIEDPIEYLHHHKKSAINQREVGEDTLSFGRALRSVLREDPDVLLVGEMRDLESIQTTLTIAETGHLVLATLHTNDTATALDRIVDVFPTDRQQQIRVQLASALIGVVAQRLVQKIGGGMCAAFEIMIVNHAVRNLVREGKTTQLRNVITTSQREGMQTLEMDLNRLVAAGVVSYDDAVAKSMHPKDVRVPAPAGVESVSAGPSEAEAVPPKGGGRFRRG